MSRLFDRVAETVTESHPADVLMMAGRMAEQFSRADLIGIYNGMKPDAAAILAGVEPGDHGDAILEAFGRRVIEAAVLRIAGAA